MPPGRYWLLEPEYSHQGVEANGIYWDGETARYVWIYRGKDGDILHNVIRGKLNARWYAPDYWPELVSGVAL